MKQNILFIFLFFISLNTIGMVIGSVCPTGIEYCNPNIPFSNPSESSIGGSSYTNNTYNNITIINATNYWTTDSSQINLTGNKQFLDNFTDSSDVNSLSPSDRMLYDQRANVSVDWINRFLEFSNERTSLDWGGGNIYDNYAGHNISIEYLLRQLDSSTGQIILNWSNPNYIIIYGNFNINNKNMTNVSYLCNSTGACFTLRDLNASSGSSGVNYWNLSGNNIYLYNLSKNIGIGTKNPKTILDINGTARVSGSNTLSGGAGLELYYSPSSGSSMLSYDRDNSQYKDIYWAGKDLYFQSSVFGAGAGDLMIKSATGSIQETGGTATGSNSHAESVGLSSGDYSHAETTGYSIGSYSHAESQGQSWGAYSHTQSAGIAYGAYSSAEGGGYTYTDAGFSHAETSGQTYAVHSHAEGSGIAYGQYSHVEGNGYTGNGAEYSHADTGGAVFGTYSVSSNSAQSNGSKSFSVTQALNPFDNYFMSGGSAGITNDFTKVPLQIDAVTPAVKLFVSSPDVTYSCQGTLSACSELTTETSCTNISGCGWWGACEGSLDCSIYNQEDCTSRSEACSWGGGTSDYCYSNNVCSSYDENTCLSNQPNCNANYNPAYCSGNGASCSGYGQEYGCNNNVYGYGSCSGNSGCESYSNSGDCSADMYGYGNCAWTSYTCIWYPQQYNSCSEAINCASYYDPWNCPGTYCSWGGGSPNYCSNSGSCSSVPADQCTNYNGCSNSGTASCAGSILDTSCGQISSIDCTPESTSSICSLDVTNDLITTISQSGLGQSSNNYEWRDSTGSVKSYIDYTAGNAYFENGITTLGNIELGNKTSFNVGDGSNHDIYIDDGSTGPLGSMVINNGNGFWFFNKDGTFVASNGNYNSYHIFNTYGDGGLAVTSNTLYSVFDGKSLILGAGTGNNLGGFPTRDYNYILTENTSGRGINGFGNTTKSSNLLIAGANFTKARNLIINFSNTTIDSNLTVLGNITSPNICYSNGINCSSDQNQNETMYNLFVTHNASISGNLTMSGGMIRNVTSINPMGSPLTIGGEINITGNLNVVGNLSVKRYYYTGYDNSTQPSGGTTVANIMNISNNNDYDAYGIVIKGKQNITFQHTGDYLCIVSPEFTNAGATADVGFWLQKNGVDVPWSNSRYTITNSWYTAPAIPYQFDITNPATDTIRFMWWSSNANTVIYSSGALTSPTRPSVPGVIINCQKVGEITE